MPKIFLLLSAALLLLSSGLSFLNKGKLSASLTNAKAAQQQATTAQADTAKARNDLKKAQQTAQESTKDAADSKSIVDGLKSQVAELTTKANNAEAEVKTKQNDLDALNKKITDITGTQPKGDASADVAKQIEDLKRQKDELQLVKDSLDNQLKASQAQLVAAQGRAKSIDDKSAMLGLRGKVLAVNREYNFVVLDLGSRNGVSGNATMIVQRGGNLVGRIRTVSVEPMQTVADIVPNSVPSGVMVQPGDTVIFPGS